MQRIDLLNLYFLLYCPHLMSANILLIDDKDSIIASIAGVLSFDGHSVMDAKNGKEGLKKFMEMPVDLVIVDYQMPEMNGIEFIKAAKLIKPDVPIVVLTAFGDGDLKASFIKEGAFGYVEKPFDVEDFREVVKNALEQSQILKEPFQLDSSDYINQEFPEIIGESEEIKQVFSLIRKVADTDATVLIEGESGTGKELVAKAIHESSSLRNGPFIRFNCAALPESLIESELFGFEKGSFTGAESQKPGRFELAQNGSIFIDEVGELNAKMQVKLLRILQEKEFERIGGTETINANFRVITATNQDLRKRVEDKSFREDLYYRLNVFPIHVPSLKDRGNDIIRLANYFLNLYTKKYQKGSIRFDEGALKQLTEYAWPGNVRELENVVSRSVIMTTTNVITYNDLNIEPEKAGQMLNDALEQNWTEETLVKHYAKQVFKKCKYNKKQTSEFLNINYRTLMKRLSDT